MLLPPVDRHESMFVQSSTAQWLLTPREGVRQPQRLAWRLAAGSVGAFRSRRRVHLHESGDRRRRMHLLRGICGAVLWLLAAVVGLLGLLLSVTVILLPVGI